MYRFCSLFFNIIYFQLLLGFKKLQKFGYQKFIFKPPLGGGLWDPKIWTPWIILPVKKLYEIIL